VTTKETSPNFHFLHNRGLGIPYPRFSRDKTLHMHMI